jgi:hypothetical protein
MTKHFLGQSPASYFRLKKAEVGVTCWELKFHLFKALVVPTFPYGAEICGENTSFERI